MTRIDATRRNLRPGNWLFLLTVLAAYGVTGLVHAELATRALELFGDVMRKVIPALGLVFVLLVIADLLLQPQWIRRNLGRDAGVRAWLIAMFAGILATGPVYAWQALLRELRDKGVRASLLAVFLYSRAVKLPLLPLMIHYFGTAYTLVLCLYLLGFSILSGALIARLEDQQHL